MRGPPPRPAPPTPHLPPPPRRRRRRARGRRPSRTGEREHGAVAPAGDVVMVTREARLMRMVEVRRRASSVVLSSSLGRVRLARWAEGRRAPVASVQAAAAVAPPRACLHAARRGGRARRLTQRKRMRAACCSDVLGRAVASSTPLTPPSHQPQTTRIHVRGSLPFRWSSIRLLSVAPKGAGEWVARQCARVDPAAATAGRGGGRGWRQRRRAAVERRQRGRGRGRRGGEEGGGRRGAWGGPMGQV